MNKPQFFTRKGLSIGINSMSYRELIRMLLLRIALDLFYGIKMLDVILELLWMKLVKLLWVKCTSSCLGVALQMWFRQTKQMVSCTYEDVYDFLCTVCHFSP